MKNKILVIILLLVVIILGSEIYFGFAKINVPVDNNTDSYINKPKEDMNKNEDKKDKNDKPNKPDDTSSKDKEIKDVIYDAKYESGSIEEAYTTTFGNKYYLKDIVVPYININSNDAKMTNKKIEEIYMTAIKVYKDGLANKYDYVDECNYKYVIKDDILSVVITVGFGATSVVHPSYYTYNFDLKTGRLLKFEDIYKIFDFNNANIDNNVKLAISDYLEKDMDLSRDEVSGNMTFDDYLNLSMDNYQKAKVNRTLGYFIENDELKVVITLAVPIDTGEIDTVLVVE